MTDSVSLANAFAHGTTDKRIEVLRQIGQTGSISQAAREAGISYKAAWQAIDTLTNLTGVSLVEKVVGGVGGGGAKLTDEGERLLQIAGVLEKKTSGSAGPVSGGNHRYGRCAFFPSVDQDEYAQLSAMSGQGPENERANRPGLSCRQ